MRCECIRAPSLWPASADGDRGSRECTPACNVLFACTAPDGAQYSTFASTSIYFGFFLSLVLSPICRFRAALQNIHDKNQTITRNWNGKHACNNSVGAREQEFALPWEVSTTEKRRSRPDPFSCRKNFRPFANFPHAGSRSTSALHAHDARHRIQLTAAVLASTMHRASAVLLVCACLVLCATHARALLPDPLVAELTEHANRDDLRAQLTADPTDARAESLAIGDLARDFVRMRSVLTQLHAPVRKWQTRQAQKLAAASASASGTGTDGAAAADGVAASILPAETMADLASTLSIWRARLRICPVTFS